MFEHAVGIRKRVGMFLDGFFFFFVNVFKTIYQNACHIITILIALTVYTYLLK